MKYVVPLFCLLLLSTFSFAQQTGPNQHYKPIKGDNYVSSKNYYLLTLFAELDGVKKMLEQDAVLSKLALSKKAGLIDAVKQCGVQTGCYIQAAKFSDEEITQVSERLGALYREGNELDKMLHEHLVPSGCYQLYAATGGKQLLIKAWEQDAKAINHAINVYAAGEKPNYPQIDSISFNVRDKSYPELLSLNAGLAAAENKENNLFFMPPLTFALQSLEINGRNRAGDDEPLMQTVNEAAVHYAQKIKWDKYAYTLILVPGEGPEDRATALSAGGMLRCRLAALQFRLGLAPFIMVSGGCVHPYQTPYNEAAEMKKFLMQTLHIPEYGILMEPHARHTTTNMRNCARLIFRYGFPMDKPCLTVTAKSQSYYITDVLLKRSEKELGYAPYRNGKRFSDTAAEFYPLAICLQIDFDEPMDP